MDKKQVAAISGVMEYLQSQEEPVVQETPPGPPMPSLWALSGRQTAMQMRTLMQLRAFKALG